VSYPLSVRSSRFSVRSHLRAADVSFAAAICALALFSLTQVATAAAPAAAVPKSVPLPLHERIDRLIEAERLAPAGRTADDAEFIRRVTLDLHGIIPTAEETEAFLADKSADKRENLIDGLLASPRFVRHFATTFDVMWGERLGDKIIKSPDWYDYLYRSFAERKPYDVMVREILTADDVDPKLRPASKFFHDRECEPNVMTRDIGRIFFGMDMQCNQCHDHPVIDDYRIADYYGLYALVSRTYLTGTKRKGSERAIAEKAEGEANFKSVFTGEAADKVAPRIPRGAVIAEPTFAKGEEFVKKPAKDEVGVPKFSRRKALAEAATTGNNELFDRNGANRLWAHVFGRGLVHPVDNIHPDNPPTHPAVLDLIAAEFRARKYDIRDLVGELVKTRAYARSFVTPQPTDLQPGLAAKQAARWSAERAKLEPQMKAAAIAAEKANDALGAARGKGAKKAATPVAAAKAEPAKDKAAAEKGKVATKDAAAAKEAAPQVDFVALQNNYETAAAEYRKLRTQFNALNARIAEAEKIVAFEKLASTDKVGAKRAWDAIVQDWNDRGEVTLLKPLPPEVFAASLMQATGLVSSAETRVKAAFKKAAPKELMAVAAAERPRMEAMLIDKQTFEPLKGSYGKFIELYGDASAGFAATLNQALFFGNGNIVESWLRPSGDNLTARLLKLTEPNALADAMFLAVYSRKPSDTERSDVVGYLKGRDKDRAVAVQEMLWGLLSASEFRFNH
jgi:hypothetical protein